MQSTGVAAVTAFTAHREWASRPPDERHQRLVALRGRSRTSRACEERIVETNQIRTEAPTDGGLALRGPSGEIAALTHWSFEQLAGIAGAPPKYLRTLPGSIASSAINYGLGRQHRDEHQLFVDRAEPWTVHAVTSQRYAGPPTSWQPGCSTSWPITRHGTCRSDTRTASTALNGYRPAPTWEIETCSSFSWMAPEPRRSHRPIARWHVSRVHPSEQRRRRRRPDPGSVPVSRRVRESCDLGLHPRGRFPAPARGRVDSRGVDGLIAIRSRRPRRKPRRRSRHAPEGYHSGARPDARGRPRSGHDATQLSRSRPQRRALAETHETNPRSVWGYVQGLTRLSQRTPWQDARFSLDQAASRFIATVN